MTHSLARLCLLLGCAGLAVDTARAAAQTSKGDGFAKQPMRKVEIRRAVTPTVSVRFSGSFATLRIIGWAHDSVVINGVIPADARLESSGAGSSGAPVTGLKGFLEPSDRAANAPPAGAVEIRVPDRARVWVKAGSAVITASGIRGGLDLAVVGGSIRVIGSPQELRADAMDGEIVVDGAPGWLRAKTASGDIILRGGSEDAQLSTVGGAIRVSDGRYDRLRLETIAGPIIFAGDLARGASVDMDTHGGTVDLILPSTFSAELDITSLTGRIDNDWSSARPVAGREGRGMELGTTVGGGGSRIIVRTFKGSVKLRPRLQAK